MDLNELEDDRRRRDWLLAAAAGLTLAGYITLLNITAAWSQPELEFSLGNAQSTGQQSMPGATYNP